MEREHWSSLRKEKNGTFSIRLAVFVVYLLESNFHLEIRLVEVKIHRSI